MKQERTKEEIEEYNRRIEEVFRKHSLIPKMVYGKGTRAIFPGNRPKGADNEESEKR